MKTILLLLSFAVLTADAQYRTIEAADDTLARMDDRVVTTQDLYERIALMPYADRLTERDHRALKRKAVASIVGEYILAADDIPAEAMPWREPYTRSVLRSLFLRDALFKREIRERVTVSEKEVTEGLKRFAKRRHLLAVRVRSGEAGRSLAARWTELKRRGTPNASAERLLGVRFDSVAVAFGSADSVLEETAYRFKDTLSVAGPLRSQLYGLMVVTFVRDDANPAAAGLSITDRRTSVRNAVRDRKESQLQVRFFDMVLRGQTMSVDSTLFTPVVSSLRASILRDTAARSVPAGFRYIPTDINDLMTAFRSRLDSPFVSGTFGSMTLGRFLEHLFYYDFSAPSLRPERFTASFLQMVRAIVEGEMASAEAERRGLQYDPEVRRDMAVWNGHTRSRVAEYLMADTVRGEEWEPYWSLWRRAPALVERHLQISVQEVLVTDSSDARRIELALRGGAAMDSVARERTLRTGWRKEGGRSGWFPFAKYPALAAKTMMVSAGTLSPPVRLPEGFSLFRVLGRRFDGDTLMLDSLLQRERLRTDTQRRSAAVTAAVAAKALNRRVEFYDDRIDRAEVPDIAMVTRRIIGFGGRLNAAPELYPQWQWVERWKRMKEMNP